jgi:hypothetical protein
VSTVLANQKVRRAIIQTVEKVLERKLRADSIDFNVDIQWFLIESGQLVYGFSGVLLFQ